MASASLSSRPLAALRLTLRLCRAEHYQRRRYAELAAPEPFSAEPPSLFQPPLPLPDGEFRTSFAIKQNRFDQGRMKPIKVFRNPHTPTATCRDPIKKVTDDQVAILDPTGARTRLFSKDNPDRVHPGDILLVRLKNGDPFSGVCLHIRKRHQPIDTAILLRNQLTRVGVEMWFKVYSPNVVGIEIVQRKEKRARRAKLYYMRQPEHDVGSVEGIVRNYLRSKVGGVSSKSLKGRDANSQPKKSKKK